MSEAADFWRQVDVLDMRSCWHWRGTRQGDYGVFVSNGEQVRTHRYAWSFAYGEIPVGALILHSCDNTWCVNPRHLRVGTHEDNNTDKSVLSRVIAVLAEQDREDAARLRPCRPPVALSGLSIHARIRQLRAALGITQEALAEQCGTTKSCVSHWEKGVTSPTSKRLPRVAAALGVSVADLFDEAAS